MLDKKDLKRVEDIVANVLSEFFHKVLAPYLDEKFKENDDDHERIFRKLDRNEDQHDEILQDQDKIEKVIKDHERRIKRVETITAA